MVLASRARLVHKVRYLHAALMTTIQKTFSRFRLAGSLLVAVAVPCGAGQSHYECVVLTASRLTGDGTLTALVSRSLFWHMQVTRTRGKRRSIPPDGMRFAYSLRSELLSPQFGGDGTLTPSHIVIFHGCHDGDTPKAHLDRRHLNAAEWLLIDFGFHCSPSLFC